MAVRSRFRAQRGVLDFAIVPVDAATQVASVRSLFRAHAESLQYYGPSFQNFEAELAALPTPFDAVGNQLFLAVAGLLGIGCVGVSRIDTTVCQMKRLYVSPDYREFNVGKALIDRAILFAKTAGYTHMRLTTDPKLTAAIALYERYGFRQIPPTDQEKTFGKLAMQLHLTGW